MLLVPFELNYEKIAKINSQQEKQSFQIAKTSSRKTQKITKLNSRKNFVPHGTVVFFIGISMM